MRFLHGLLQSRQDTQTHENVSVITCGLCEGGAEGPTSFFMPD